MSQRPPLSASERILKSKCQIFPLKFRICLSSTEFLVSKPTSLLILEYLGCHSTERLALKTSHLADLAH